jgi:hypothetical protein
MGQDSLVGSTTVLASSKNLPGCIAFSSSSFEIGRPRKLE